jgi:hypothetical protein
VQECGGDEIGSLEDLKVAFGVVMALGAVDDGFSGGDPGDFLQREWMSQQILGESLATTVVVGIDEVVTAIVNVKSGKRGQPSPIDIYGKGVSSPLLTL